jgi:hypothetical protein
MVLRYLAYATLFLAGTALISRYLIKHHWKKGAALLAGFLTSSLIGIIESLGTNKLPSDLIITLLILIGIIYLILRFLILDNTYVPADKSQGMGYKEQHEIELKECPNCGLKIAASSKTCLSCGFDLTENASVTDMDMVNTIDTVDKIDPVSDDVGFAPDPDHLELDEVDRRSAVFVMGILLSLAAVALLIYFINS